MSQFEARQRALGGFEPDIGPIDGLRTIPQLVQDAKAQGDGDHYSKQIRRFASEPLKNLLIVGSTSDDPLTQWILHRHLDRQGVPPCLRWKLRPISKQAVFIAFAADMNWLIRNNSAHRTAYTRWQGIFSNIGSDSWHKIILWVFRQSKSGQVGFYFSKGLGLTDEQMQPLQTLNSNRQRANKRLLGKLDTYHEEILKRALVYRDRSSRQTPNVIADRRVEILRMYLLADRNATLAAYYLKLMTGRAISRQAFMRQIEEIKVATRLRLPNS